MEDQLAQSSRQEQQASSLNQKFEASTSANPEPEEQKAREKMGAIIDKLDASINEKGIIAQVVGDKDEHGDHRAAILTEPVVQREEGKRGEVGYVVLTPDGPMIISITDPVSGGRSINEFMLNNINPADYPRQREFLKELRYKSEKMGSIVTYRLEGQIGNRPTTVYMLPVGRSTIRNVDVEAIFDKSIERAAKPLESLKNQAINTAKLADSLQSKF